MGRDDVLVVGAGMAGLIAATTAARAGATVRLLDARRSPGGRARTHDEAGFRFNEGPHALYRGTEVEAVLDRLGVAVTGGVPSTTEAHGIDLDDRLVPLPGSPLALLRSKALGWRAKLGSARLFGRIGRMDPTSMTDRSVGDWLAAHVPDPTARRFADALVRVTTYVDDPDSLSADAGLLQVQRALDQGVHYVDGGWRSIIDGLMRSALSAGVRVESGAAVRSITPDGDDGCDDPSAGRRWTVTTDDGPRTARAVVLAAGGPGHAASLAGEAAPVLRHWADAAVPVTASHLDVGLAGPWTAPPVVRGLGRPVYLSVHAPVASGLAPEGHVLVSTLRYHRAGEVRDAAQDRAELEALLDTVRPGWRDDALVVRFGARLVVTHDRPMAGRGGLSGRPGPEVPGTAGLFVAGDWVGPHGLLADAAAASGEAAGSLAAAQTAPSVPARVA
jgi:phytoene dehydrogenase-like protein